MLSDILSEAISKIEDELSANYTVYEPIKGLIDGMVADMIHLRWTLDTPPPTSGSAYQAAWDAATAPMPKKGL